METQDHRKANQSGHEGHGGVHVCHKCGWPFPNPHPSSRHRRAHKRVCGTIEGYSLDNSRDKTQLDGSDDEQFYEDDSKTPSGKFVERTISRRSSSGVSIRSCRSTRSEDEVFADAVTDFIDSQNPEEAAYGAISRGNSLQNISKDEPDGTKHSSENAISDTIPAANNLLEDKQLQDTQPLEGENEKVEAGMLSEDHSSSCTNNPTPVSASVTRENEIAVEQNLMQSSITSSELEVVAEEGKDIVSSKNLSELETRCSETGKEACEDVSVLGGASQEVLDSASADGMLRTTGMQSFGNEDKVEYFPDVNSSGNFHASVHSVQGVEDADGNTNNASDKKEEHDSLIQVNENSFSLAVPDAEPLQEQPEIAVDDVDHKGGKFKVPVDPVTTLAVERVDNIKANTTEERCSDTNFAKPGEGTYAGSVDDVVNSVHSTEDMLEHKVGQNNFIAEQKTVEELELISDVKLSDADIIEFRSEEVLNDDIKTGMWKDEKVSCIEEHKSIVPSAIPDDATVGDGDDQETGEIGGANACDRIEDRLDHFAVPENDSNKILVGESVATISTVADTAVGDTETQVMEPITAHESNDVVYDEEGKVDGTVLNGNEVKIEEEKKPASPEAAPGCGLSVAESDDKNDELFELERNHDQGKLDKILDSGNVMGVHSEADSLLTSSGVSGIRSVDDNMGGVECINKNNTDAIVKSDDGLDSNMKMSEGAGSSPNSAAVADTCSGKFADNASGFTEGEKVTKQPAAVSAVDIADSSSQTDSLEGNWGSVSVLSAVSDTLPAFITAAPTNSQASPEARTVSSEPKVGGEVQHTEGKTSVELHAVLEQVEGAPEIQTSQNQQQQSSALHTANEPLGGKRDEEIIAKVNNWSNGKQQHTALKTLLGEATARSRAESPNHDEDSAPQKDEIPVTNNGFSAKRENLGSEEPKAESVKEEMGKEWNSPARYPVNIKTEKRKSRPLWAPFLCCSSVNAN